MILYQILYNGYYGGSVELPESEGIPPGTTRKSPPEIPEGQYAIWNGSGWYLTSIPPSDPAPIKVVPESITKYQAKMALLEVGLYQQVETFVKNSDDDALKISWYDAVNFQRDHHFINSLSEQFNLSTEQVDDIFILATNY